MTETEQLADVIALSIHAALEPLRRDIAALKSLAAIPGPAGRDGKDGRAGVDGKDGLPGLAGRDGRDGIDGKDGAAGLTGKDGLQGLIGPIGVTGAVGPQGPQGVAGLAGKDGAIGLSGKDGRDAMVDPALLTSLTDRLESVEIKADLAQRIERDVTALKSQMLQIKTLELVDTIPANRLSATVAEVLAEELAALGASPWPSS